MTDPAQIVAEWVAKHRADHGLSVRDAADQSGLTPSTISRIERGVSDPSLSSLVAIAQWTGRSLLMLQPTPHMEDADLPEPPSDNAPFGEWLRYWRADSGSTQAEVAKHCGVGVPHISKVESGRETPGYLLVMALADLFDLDEGDALETAGRCRHCGSHPDPQHRARYPSLEDS